MFLNFFRPGGNAKYSVVAPEALVADLTRLFVLDKATEDLSPSIVGVHPDPAADVYVPCSAPSP